MTVLRFTCPFCGKCVGVSSMFEAVIHELPPCQKFIDLEVHEFLHAVNVKLGNYEKIARLN
jgi:hypothetical protein